MQWRGAGITFARLVAAKVNEEIEKNLSPVVGPPVFCSVMTQPKRLAAFDHAASTGSIDRMNVGPRDGLVLRTSLSSALKMRQRHAATADAPECLRRRQARIAIDLAISNVFGIDAERLWSGTRGVRDIAEARQVAMYLAHVCCGMSLTAVGTMFGRDRTTVAHACLKVEWRRDDPNFDRALDVLSWALPTLALRPPVRERLNPLPTTEEHEWL
jgi:hypothetical protein